MSSWKDRVTRPSAEFPRNYLTSHIDLSRWGQLEPVLAELVDREIPDKSALLAWIRDFTEVESAVSEESSRLYIDMTCFTEDKQKEKAYLEFVANVEPRIREVSDRINRKIAAHPSTDELDGSEYGKWVQSVRNELELFKKENIPLQTEIAKGAQAYQKVMGALTAEWEGEIKTLSQLSPHLESRDRDIREKAWTKIAKRRMDERETFNRQFNHLLGLRQKVAGNLGMDPVAYYFKQYERDYTPEHCHQFHDAVEKVVVPVYRKNLEHRRTKLGLDRLRPWDLVCELVGDEPLRPFQEIEGLKDGVERIFEQLDPELHGYFQTMRQNELLDLDNRVGKAPGGYQSALDEARLPFIFMNAVGLNQDVFTLLHESGHAFHQFLSRSQGLLYNRHAPMEFSEVASMSMERLGARCLNEFYNPREIARALAKEYEGILGLLGWIATIDKFQHWLYTHPNHSETQREDYWIELDERFGPGVDWSDHEEYRRSVWQKQLHLYEYPFYYIEYGIAQLGALQIWAKSLQNEAEALAGYKKALSLGGTRGAPDLFAAAGIRFDFQEDMIGNLMGKVQEHLSEIWEKLG